MRPAYHCKQFRLRGFTTAGKNGELKEETALRKWKTGIGLPTEFHGKPAASAPKMPGVKQLLYLYQYQKLQLEVIKKAGRNIANRLFISASGINKK